MYYQCVKTVVMEPEGDIAYYRDRIYKATKHPHNPRILVMPSEIDEHHNWYGNQRIFKKHFKHIRLNNLRTNSVLNEVNLGHFL